MKRRERALSGYILARGRAKNRPPLLWLRRRCLEPRPAEARVEATFNPGGRWNSSTSPAVPASEEKRRSSCVRRVARRHQAPLLVPDSRIRRGMDTYAGARDNRLVAALGRSRERLAGVLNSAFAEGLLSEQTHSYRLGLLFGPRLIDPQRLVGDLTHRRGRLQPTAVARHAWSALAARVRAATGCRGPSIAPLLLVLDRADSDRLLVGRDPACEVVLPDPSVSRRHAQLTFRDGVWVLRDLSSTNGTIVNGQRVGRTTLHPGDIVELGNQVVQVD